MPNPRPIIDIPMTTRDWLLEVVALAALLGLVVGVVSSYTELPQTIATHFNAAGKADDWGSKGTLFLLPALSVALYAMFTILARFPQACNYPGPVTAENAPRLYAVAVSLMRWLKAEIIALFAFLSNAMVVSAKPGATGVGTLLLPITLVLVFGTVAWHVVRLRQAR